MASKSQKGIFLNNKNPKNPKRFESLLNFKQERRRYKRRRRRKRCLRSGNWISGRLFSAGLVGTRRSNANWKSQKKEIKESSKAPPPNLPSPPQQRVSKLALYVSRWPRAYVSFVEVGLLPRPPFDLPTCFHFAFSPLFSSLPNSRWGGGAHSGRRPRQLLLTAHWAGKWAGSFASSGLMYISVIHHPYCILGFPRTTINQCFRPPPLTIRFASAEVLWPSRQVP